MFEARPPQSPGVPVGYAIIVALLLVSAASIYLLFNRPITLLSFFLGLVLFVSAPTVALIAYWTAALSRARYLLTPELLQITWGPLRHELPLSNIQLVDAAEVGARLQAFRGLRWPGYLLGRGRLDNSEAASITLFATQPPPGPLLIASSGDWYGLSLQEPDAFREALESAISGAPQEVARSPVRHSGWLSWAIWRDRTARILLVVAPLLNGAHFALLAGLLPTLPGTVPLHVNNAGAVLLSGPSSRLFLPPLFGLLSWLTNAILGWYFYQRRAEPTVAYLLWGAAVALQLVAWASLLLLFS